VTKKLLFASDISRRVRMFVSHPVLASFPVPYDKEFAVSAK